MNAEPLRARLCQCEHPLLDGETCLRCGRWPSVMPEAPLSRPRVRQKVTWTRPAVLRAIRAFAFFRGRAPMPGDWNQRMADWPPRATVETLFGSVEAAARAAGIKPDRPAAGE
jgi:polyferredoxin